LAEAASGASARICSVFSIHYWNQSRLASRDKLRQSTILKRINLRALPEKHFF
jgi:hypothetical protein